MKSITGGMEAHLLETVTSLCTCWKVTRNDGEIYGFTDHDRDLTINGIDYKAATGYYRSAISNSADSGVDNLDVQGFLDDDSLNETELRNGAYDYAQVEVFAVNWQDLSDGVIRLRYGYFGEVMIVSSGFFRVELRGLTQLFAQTIGETYAPECRADLGDERCKVPLIPSVRKSRSAYGLNARMIVPDDPGKSIRLPLKNGSFEAFDNTDNVAWGGTNYRVVNYDMEEADYVDAFYIEPEDGDETGNVVFSRTATQVPTGVPSYVADLDVFADGMEFRLRVYWGTSGNVSQGGGYEADTGWVSYGIGSHNIDLGDILPFLSNPNNVLRWTMEWRPDGSEPPLTEADFHFVGYPKVDGEIVQQSVLAPVGTSVDNALGWVVPVLTGGEISGPNLWLSPYSGDRHLVLAAGPDVTLTAYQDINLSYLDAADFLIIDAGGFDAEITLQWAAETQGVKNTIGLEFYSGTMVLLGLHNSDTTLLGGRGFWEEKKFRYTVPPQTRLIRVNLSTWNYTNNARARGAFDSVSVMMYEPSYEYQDSYLTYNGVEFVCTTAGTTDPEAPAYNYTLGAVTVDGTAEFTAVVPIHMFSTEITSVTNNKKFIVDGTNINKAGDWFDWGVLEVLTGLNIRKKLEIKKWDNATKEITLALPLPYIPQVGDKVRFHTGCAKSRAVCVDKFDNIKNYRGEPDLPGTDQYFKIGAANSGGSLPAPGGKGGNK